MQYGMLYMHRFEQSGGWERVFDSRMKPRGSKPKGDKRN